MSTTTTFDLTAHKLAIEARDAAALLAAYAGDADVILVDRVAQPSTPRTLNGRTEIQAWLEDVYGRDMTHAVNHSVADEHGAAFTLSCSYPDGTKVLCATVLEIADGQIARQVVVQAWDE